MPNDSPAAAAAVTLTTEHEEIDTGLKAFLAALDPAVARDGWQVEPLREAMQALRRHIYVEEAFLFPPIYAAGLVMPIVVMLREHGQLWRLMDLLSDLLAGAAADRPDPEAAAQLRTTGRKLMAALDHHNRKEEPVVYPRAVDDLTHEASLELVEVLRTGRLPDGWVCRQAAG